ncbi:iron/zinc purple acid phosphatase-like protein [Salpingoeca rosetta]|uniref:Purple acid phosphatase n=1 Tax=Salpingoeca rosetta (strain ATCC 50818 / BSB-021) TaxID=946362 RepID=F2UE49_SALR5|nr:iron/zinc purple acid phosphatase-like protein [Salpingoeca rosetta]EGD74899.1 iron/zinc purple acid phosphatase-like protein [Salpingoeca rosetta]|eukprot:XP_004992544.1 iron/zinc purple acid phosphatase-like protein [Salpingoeca rosetta]
MWPPPPPAAPPPAAPQQQHTPAAVRNRGGTSPASTTMIKVVVLMAAVAVVAVAAMLPAACSGLGSEATQPEQVHIALAGLDAKGNPNGMAVSWQTHTRTATSVVRYGLNSTALTMHATGNCSSYYATFDHHVVLHNLLPKTRYYYQVGDATGGWSKVFSFVSAPLSSRDMPINFAVWGDLGVVNGDSTLAFLNNIKDNIDLMWHAGDIAYADDTFIHLTCATKFCYEDIWNEYMNLMQPLASGMPYMTTPGNHEAECHSPACLLSSERREALRNFTAYNHRFRMPSPESGGVLNMWHSFNYGPVHFVSLDTETAFPLAPEEHMYVLPCGGFGDMLTWLEQDLIEANKHRDERPWILAASHHPMYFGGNINEPFQKAIEDLFHKYNVDMYFAGHKHSYERDYPVYKGVPQPTYYNPNSTVYITVGGAGNDEMEGDQVERNNQNDVITRADESDMWQSNPNEGVAVKKDNGYYGIGVVHVLNSTALHFEYYRTTLQEKYDEVYLFKNH